MARLPFLLGAYESRSLIANAQRCVNLYPEKNPHQETKDGDAPVMFTLYPTPGLAALCQSNPNSPVRGLYFAPNEKLYAVIGAKVFYVTSTWTLVPLGTMLSQSTPVSIADNGTYVVLVDGTASGYKIDMVTDEFSAISDSNFLGSTRVDYLDTYTIFNTPNGAEFYCTESNTLVCNPLYFAQKSVSTDLLTTHAVVNSLLWLFGTMTTEVWFTSGGAAFPFSKSPGVAIQHGCAARYSVATIDTAVFWLGAERQGKGIVFMGVGTKAERISTHAIEVEFASYSTIADARGWTYQLEGHAFYVLTFPTADKTWVFDMATGLWHERVWIDENGAQHRHRGVCHAFAYGVHVVGDHSNGTLYAMSNNVYTDNGEPIPRIRSFPHLVTDGKRVRYDQFLADIETGNTLEADAKIALRWSDTRGASWGNPVEQELGGVGEHGLFPQWRRLGVGRDRVFELRWSAPVRTALNGAFIEGEALGT